MCLFHSLITLIGDGSRIFLKGGRLETNFFYSERPRGIKRKDQVGGGGGGGES